MDPTEELSTNTRVTRSLRKRLSSVDVDNSQTPIKTSPNESSKSRGTPTRITRRRLSSQNERIGTPIPLVKLSKLDVEHSTIGSPVRRSTRRRSIALEDEAVPGKQRPHIFANSIPEEDQLDNKNTEKDTIPTRVTRSISKSPNVTVEQKDVTPPTTISSKEEELVTPKKKQVDNISRKSESPKNNLGKSDKQKSKNEKEKLINDDNSGKDTISYDENKKRDKKTKKIASSNVSYSEEDEEEEKRDGDSQNLKEQINKSKNSSGYNLELKTAIENDKNIKRGNITVAVEENKNNTSKNKSIENFENSKSDTAGESQNITVNNSEDDEDFEQHLDEQITKNGNESAKKSTSAASNDDDFKENNSEKKTRKKSVTFSNFEEDENISSKFPKTPVQNKKNSFSKEAKFINESKSNQSESDEDVSKENNEREKSDSNTEINENSFTPKIPYKEIISKISSSTPIADVGGQQKVRDKKQNKSMEMLKHSPIKNSSTGKVFSKSWSQSVRGIAGNNIKIDKLVLEQDEEVQHGIENEINESKNNTKPTDSGTSDENATEEELEDEENEHLNEFIHSEAVEVGSEDSLDSEERAYIEQNEIPVRGESLRSDEEETEQDDYENDSFVVSDSDGHAIPVDSDSESAITADEDSSIKKKKIKQLTIEYSSSSSEETEKNQGDIENHEDRTVHDNQAENTKFGNNSLEEKKTNTSFTISKETEKHEDDTGLLYSPLTNENVMEKNSNVSNLSIKETLNSSSARKHQKIATNVDSKENDKTPTRTSIKRKLNLSVNKDIEELTAESNENLNKDSNTIQNSENKSSEESDIEFEENTVLEKNEKEPVEKHFVVDVTKFIDETSSENETADTEKESSKQNKVNKNRLSISDKSKGGRIENECKEKNLEEQNDEGNEDDIEFTPNIKKNIRSSSFMCKTAETNNANSTLHLSYTEGIAYDKRNPLKIPLRSKAKSESDENKAKKFDTGSIDYIINRCDAILEAANIAKREAKLKAKKKQQKKVKATVKHAVSQEIEKFSPEKKKIQEITKAIKHSQNLLQSSSTEKPKHTATSIELGLEENRRVTSKRLPEDILTAIEKPTKIAKLDLNKDNTNEKINENQFDSQFKENFKNQTKIKVESNGKKAKPKLITNPSGVFVEELLSPLKKIKTSIKLPSGTICEEPVTPKNKKLSGFKESQITPKPLGCKIREILSAGQKEPPVIKKKKSAKRKMHIEEPSTVLPKPHWISSGAVFEEKFDSVPHCDKSVTTEFVISSLEQKKSKKFKSSFSSVGLGINKNALDFKKQTFCNKNINRESSKQLLQRKERKLFHENF